MRNSAIRVPDKFLERTLAVVSAGATSVAVQQAPEW